MPKRVKNINRSLKTFEIYGRGWLRRNDEVLAKAKSMVS